MCVQAAFILFFDDKEPTVESEGANCDEEMTTYCKDLLHGNGYTRWFDKSMTAVVYANGKVSQYTLSVYSISVVYSHHSPLSSTCMYVLSLIHI